MVLFRADANEHIATGHLMRCLTIAQALRGRGEECLFAMAEEKGADVLSERGFPFVCLKSRWDDLEGELDALCELIRSRSPRVLVVDSYQVTERYLKILDGIVPVLYIDDIGESAWPVSMALRYTVWPGDGSFQALYAGSGTRVLSGMSYVPIREEFYPRAAASGAGKADAVSATSSGAASVTAAGAASGSAGAAAGTTSGGEVSATAEGVPAGRVLITTGGTDPFHVAERFLTAIFGDDGSASPQECGAGQAGASRQECAADSALGRAVSDDDLALLRQMEYVVVSGGMNESFEGLQRLSGGHKGITVYGRVNCMGELMRSSDIAISAGGTTLYELCACALPTVCFSFADNQVPFVRAAGERGVMLCAGDPRDGVGDFICSLVKSVLSIKKDPALAAGLSSKMQSLVDGKGAGRVADAILAFR